MSSFDSDPSVIATGPRGQKVHGLLLDHTARLERRLYTIRPRVWTLVGNGLSNQTFIEGPEGIVVIDTGESDEEMAAALAELRKHTQAPLAAVIYTHFHYVFGTRAAFKAAGRDLPVYGHERIAGNLARVVSAIGPTYWRGLVHQFGMRLPADGPDGLVNVGLGLSFRNPDHAPFTYGHVPVTHPLRGGERLTIAGLAVETRHAPSDADDSMTFWFPKLGVCVQNLVWPALFNIFAIRGEAYRDPQVLLAGIDDVLAYAPEHLAGTHGPPLSGAADIRARATRYRDSIQFLWDQTVRGLNRGLTTDEVAHEVRLPALFADDYLTSELYGVAEHHVRQIAAGSTATRPGSFRSNRTIAPPGWSKASVASRPSGRRQARRARRATCAGRSNSHRGSRRARRPTPMIVVFWPICCATSPTAVRPPISATGV